MIFNRDYIKKAALFILIFVFVGSLFFLFKLKNNEEWINLLISQSTERTKIAVVSDFLLDIVNIIGKNKIKAVLIEPDYFIEQIEKSFPPKDLNVIFALDSGMDKWVYGVKKYAPRADIVFINDLIKQYVDSYENQNVRGTFYGERSARWYSWISFRNPSFIFSSVARKLGEFDELNREFFIDNSYEYRIAISNLYKDYLDSFGLAKKKKIMTIGNSFNDIARDLDMRIYRTVSEDELRKDGFVDALKNEAKNKGVFAFIIDGSLPKSISSELAGIGINYAIIDPFGFYYGEKTYSGFINKNASEILRALR